MATPGQIRPSGGHWSQQNLGDMDRVKGRSQWITDFSFFFLLLLRRNSNPVLKHSDRVTALLCFRTIFRRTSSGCRAVKNFGELVQIFPFQEAVYAAWKHLQKAKRNKRTQAAKSDEAECFLSTWQEALAQLESCDTKMRKSTMTYLSSRNLGPQKISVKFRGPNSSRF